MIALIIILGIIAAIYAFLRFSVRISYSFDSTADNKAAVSVKYFFSTLYENPESEKFKQKKARKEKRRQAKEEKKRNKELKKQNKTQTVAEPKPLKTQADLIDEINSLDEQETEQEIRNLEKELAEQKRILTELEEKEKNGEKLKPDISAKKIKTDGQKIKSKLKDKKVKKEKTKDKEPSKLSELKEQWQQIKPYIPIALTTCRKLFRKIRFYDTDIDILLGNDDPYKAAMNYGYASAAFYPTLAFICTVFSVKFKNCQINTDFVNDRFEVKVSGKIYLRVSTVLAIGISSGIKLLSIYFKQKKNDKANDDKTNKKELVKNG